MAGGGGEGKWCKCAKTGSADPFSPETKRLPMVVIMVFRSY